LIPKECKRLAEVDFPIAVVGRHALAEKARRFGTPHQLHLWWAWRPLAACRAMLMALLLPDPCDVQCPAAFKLKARELLSTVAGTIGVDDFQLRQHLLAFLGDFAAWELAVHPVYLEVARGLIKTAHSDETPLVVDSFAGGGSIPIEAIRLGCDTAASDLNSVASLIQKAKLADIPRHGPSVGDDFRQAGKSLREAAVRLLSECYPTDPGGSTPIAYTWARSVRCESPHCGAEIPLIRSFWLCKKADRRRALQFKVLRPKGKPPQIDFEVFEPANEREVPTGTISGARATCPCCNVVLPPDRVRAQLRDQRGGADTLFDKTGNRVGGARMLSVVALHPGLTGRFYRVPTDRDYEPVWHAHQRLAELLKTPLPGGLSQVPDEPLPPQGTLGFRVQLYGMLQWGDLFTARQKLAFATLCAIIRNLKEEDCDQTLIPLLAMVCSKLADRCNSLVNWSIGVECPNQLFKGNALPMAWDFAESNLLCESSGSIYQTVENIAVNASATFIPSALSTDPTLNDARELLLPDDSVDVFFTDPPYYDAVPYAYLSDFFLVWLKRALPEQSLLHDPFDRQNPLSSKAREIVQDDSIVVDGHPKDRIFFELSMARAFAEGRRVLKDDGIGAIVFAHKTTEGWEALLTGIIRGGWVVTSSWPIATERAARMRARESAALATSVHLVCRPRSEDAEIGDWAAVLRELPKRVGDWMERLQSEGIRGADLVFACIGPALEIYSRYSKVVDAEEREVPLGGNPEATDPHERGYLAYVWEVVGRTALEHVLGTSEAKARNGAAGALEEDSRLTALFLWTLETSAAGTNDKSSGESDAEEDTEDEDDMPRSKKKGLSLPYDVVRRIAQPLGIHLPEWERRIIETTKGVVRLLPVAERAEQLFGEEGAAAVARDFERAAAGQGQLKLFPDEQATPEVKTRGRNKKTRAAISASAGTRREATTLDRIHAAMLLQTSGQANALRRLLQEELDRGPGFVRLANALSALYPKDSDEKRLLDAMLLAVPR
jgi:putative DNA methylase